MSTILSQAAGLLAVWVLTAAVVIVVVLAIQKACKNWWL